jgi:hypothetical protein
MPPDAPLTFTREALTAAAVAALADEWAALADAAAEDNLFLRPWFVRPSLPLLAAMDPHLVTVRQGGALIGLTIVRGGRGFAKMPVHFLRNALHYEQYLGTPLVRAGAENAFARGLFAVLDAAPARVMLLHLALMGADGPVAAALLAAARAEGRPVMTLSRTRRAAITLPRPAGAPDAHLPASRRKSLRRQAAALAALGTVTRERLDDPAQLDAWMGDFLAMEHAGWKGAQGSSLLSCPHETALYRAIVPAAAARGMLHFARLCLDGRPIAYTLDIGQAPAIYSLKSAFDPALKKYSPGVLAEAATLTQWYETAGPARVDSCTSPDNALLNELWPDQRPLAALSIARRGMVYSAFFTAARLLKRLKYGRDAV